MAKEKNEHNDRYMALYTVKKNKNCLLILDAIANTPMKMIHIWTMCKVTQQFANNREHFCNQVWVVEEMRNYGLDYIDTRATTIKKTYSLLLS